MIRRYALVSGRIRQELRNLERVVNRIEGGMAAARKRPEDQDFYLDSIALNLHDFYAALERIFHYIASHLEQSVPTDGEWHRELLRQMNVEVPGVRPTVLSVESVWALDEYLRFRHVVRNVHTPSTLIPSALSAWLGKYGLVSNKFGLICWPLLALWNVWLPTRNDCVLDCSRPCEPI